MRNDPLIDEIREIRHRISAECGHDSKRLLKHYQELKKTMPDVMAKAVQYVTKKRAGKKPDVFPLLNIDPITEEIHAIRRRISAEHGHNSKRLVKHYMDLEKQLAKSSATSRTPKKKARKKNTSQTPQPAHRRV